MQRGLSSVVVTACVAIAIGTPVGCSTFGGEDPVPAADGGGDGTAPEGSALDGAADGGPGCALDCSGRKECVMVDFEGCAGVDLTGTPGKAACKGGKLVIDATGTDQAFGTVTLKPLATGSVAHVILRGTIDDWIGSPNRQLIQISSGTAVLATVNASTGGASVSFELCGGTTGCATVAKKAPKGAPFTLSFVVRPDKTGDLAIDCEVTGTFTADNGALAKQNFLVLIGGQDGSPLKGSFDDVTVWFDAP